MAEQNKKDFIGDRDSTSQINVEGGAQLQQPANRQNETINNQMGQQFMPREQDMQVYDIPVVQDIGLPPNSDSIKQGIDAYNIWFEDLNCAILRKPSIQFAKKEIEKLLRHIQNLKSQHKAQKINLQRRISTKDDKIFGLQKKNQQLKQQLKRKDSIIKMNLDKQRYRTAKSDVFPCQNAEQYKNQQSVQSKIQGPQQLTNVQRHKLIKELNACRIQNISITKDYKCIKQKLKEAKLQINQLKLQIETRDSSPGRYVKKEPNLINNAISAAQSEKDAYHNQRFRKIQG